MSSSKRPSLCFVCKGEENVQIKPKRFVSCKTCSSRYHIGCIPKSPRPLPNSTTWSCARCIRKGRAAPRELVNPLEDLEMSSLIRSPSQEAEANRSVPRCQTEDCRKPTMNHHLCFIHQKEEHYKMTKDKLAASVGSAKSLPPKKPIDKSKLHHNREKKLRKEKRTLVSTTQRPSGELQQQWNRSNQESPSLELQKLQIERNRRILESFDSQAEENKGIQGSADLQMEEDKSMQDLGPTGKVRAGLEDKVLHDLEVGNRAEKCEINDDRDVDMPDAAASPRPTSPSDEPLSPGPVNKSSIQDMASEQEIDASFSAAIEDELRDSRREEAFLTDPIPFALTSRELLPQQTVNLSSITDQREEMPSNQLQTQPSSLWAPKNLELERQKMALTYNSSAIDAILVQQAQSEMLEEEDPNPHEILATQLWGYTNPSKTWVKQKSRLDMEEKRREIDARKGKKANFGKLLTPQIRKARAESGEWLAAPKEGVDYLDEWLGIPAVGNLVPMLKDGRLAMRDKPVGENGRHRRKTKPKVLLTAQQ